MPDALPDKIARLGTSVSTLATSPGYLSHANVLTTTPQSHHFCSFAKSAYLTFIQPQNSGKEEEIQNIFLIWSNMTLSLGAI